MRTLVFIALIASAASVFAAGPATRTSFFKEAPTFYAEKERGWFWYEREPEEEEQEPSQPTPPPPPVEQPAAVNKSEPQQPEPFSVKWFKEKLESYKENAIDNPTKENVAAYIALQRVMLDKASKFTDTWQDIIRQDTDFTEAKRRPINTAGGDVLDEEASRAKEKVTKSLSEKIGIWFFFKSDCGGCAKQYAALKALESEYKFKVLSISMDGKPLAKTDMKEFQVDKGHSAQLGVNIAPTVFAFQPPNNFIKITEWITSTDELIDRLLHTARAQGLIDDTTMAATRPFNNYSVPVDIGKKVSNETMNDPKALTEFIRQSIRANTRPINR